MNRADFWANNGRWEHFLTSYEGGHWTPAAPIPNTSSRPDGIFQIAPGAAGVWTAWVNDNRSFGGPGGFAANPGARHEIDAAPFALPPPGPDVALDPFAETPGNAALVHAKEPDDVSRIRSYRASIAGADYRILRGDFHR